MSRAARHGSPGKGAAAWGALAVGITLGSCTPKSAPAGWVPPGAMLTVRVDCPADQRLGVPRVWVGTAAALVRNWDAERVVFVMPAGLRAGRELPVRMLWGGCEPSGLKATPGIGGTGSGGDGEGFGVTVSSQGRESRSLRRAQVFLDGVPVGETNMRGRMRKDHVAAGPHRVTVHHDGYGSATLAGFEGRIYDVALPRLQEGEPEAARTAVAIEVKGACAGEGVLRWSYTDPITRERDTREIPFKHSPEPGETAPPKILVQNVAARAGGAILGLMNCPAGSALVGTAVRDQVSAEPLVVQLTEARAAEIPVRVSGGAAKEGQDPGAEVAVFIHVAREELLVATGRGPEARLQVPVVPGATVYTVTVRRESPDGEVWLRAPLLGLGDMARGLSFSLPAIPRVTRASTENGLVTFRWEAVPGAQAYRLQVGEVASSRLLPRWDIWAAAPSVGLPSLGLSIPLDEAPVTPAHAGVTLTAIGSLGYSAEQITLSGLMDLATVLARPAVTVLEPGVALGRVATAQDAREGPAAAGPTAPGLALDGVWLASWEAGGLLAKAMPGLLVRKDSGAWIAENMGAYPTILDIKPDGMAALVAARAGPDMPFSSLVLRGGFGVAEDVGVTEFKGEVDLSGPEQGGGNPSTSVVLRRIPDGPQRYRAEGWRLVWGKKRGRVLARVIFGPGGQFFSGGLRPEGTCEGAICWAVMESWQVAKDGSVAALATSAGDCPQVVRLSATPSAEGNLRGRFELQDCRGADSGSFTGERLR